jgi:hypothetical protein
VFKLGLLKVKKNQHRTYQSMQTKKKKFPRVCISLICKLFLPQSKRSPFKYLYSGPGQTFADQEPVYFEFSQNPAVHHIF